ncbi:hypothetical protein [Bradyrhizobium sp. AZCC 1693]|uniref:hypothetical protein n=1 Tax=Bradyrhizobium sp. AZCC 1693 TaxID=3117029 RepID=UPI002FF0C49C
MTLAQIVEKPITVAIDDAINSFPDNRQGRRPESFPNQPFLTGIFPGQVALPSEQHHPLQTFRYAPDKWLRPQAATAI